MINDISAASHLIPYISMINHVPSLIYNILTLCAVICTMRRISVSAHIAL